MSEETFASFRELVATRDALTAALHDVQIRQARLDHLPKMIEDMRAEQNAKLDRLLDRLERNNAVNTGETGAALAIHNAADAFRSVAARASVSSHPAAMWALVGSMGAALVYLLYRLIAP